MQITNEQLIELLRIDLEQTRKLTSADKFFGNSFFVEAFGLNYQILDLVLTILGVPEESEEYARDYWYEKFYDLEEGEGSAHSLQLLIDEALAFAHEQHKK